MRITDGQTATYQALANIVDKTINELPAESEPKVEIDSGPDRVASRLLAHMATGKRLNRNEIDYIAQTRPDQYGLVAKSCAERKSLERQMHKAKSKQEVRNAHVAAVAHAGKMATTAGEGFTRVNQLTDARNEYMKSPEYWKKPDQTDPRHKKRVTDNSERSAKASKPCPKSCDPSFRLKKAGGRTQG